jgi:acetoin:2,6-dichlorophenolindophenol oxidoreductase subunit beta
MNNSTFATGINQALNIALDIDQNVICYGLGVTDPKAIFGTTSGLELKYGSNRVFDMPTSENAMTGVAIGAALGGIRSIMTHQRTDFFLLAMDQLINGAAKYHYMFGGQTPVPITIRLIIGRGWGQGPTHSQNLHAWFAHIPGLKVVMPSSPSDAKGLLLSSIFDNNPVIFLEHRWLHNSVGDIPEGDYRVPLGSAAIVKLGSDITIVSSSYMVVEAIHAANYLKKIGVSCEIIDLRTIKPIDWGTISKSVKKTGRLLSVDSGFSTGSVSGEIISRVIESNWNDLRCSPIKLAMPDVPEPTSPALTKGFYIRARDIAQKIIEMCNVELEIPASDLIEPEPHDVPGKWFTGPF